MNIHYFKGLPVYNPDAMEQIINCCKEIEIKVLSSLPYIACEIIDILGFESGFTYIYKHGGKKIHMPKCRQRLPIEVKNETSDILFKRLEKLIDSSGYIEIPSPWGVYSSLRKVFIEECIKSNDANTLQQNFGLTVKSIYNIKKNISSI